jgi:hypothetical protein
MEIDNIVMYVMLFLQRATSDPSLHSSVTLGQSIPGQGLSLGIGQPGEQLNYVS